MLENESMNTAQNIEEMDDENNESEITPFRAHSIFENSVINMANEALPEDEQIHSDEKFSLRWSVDKNFPDGHFKLENKMPAQKSDPEIINFIFEPAEGDEPPLKTEKMSDQAVGMEDKIRYNLNTAAVKEAFTALKPEVQKIFLNGWRESLEDNKRKQIEFKTALANTLLPDKIKKLEENLADFEKGQKKIEKMLEALQ